MSNDDILFERRGRLGHVRLNRTAALNALTLDMCKRFRQQMDAWANDPAIETVAITGAGDRAFCAGGDIRTLQLAPAGDPQRETFFWHEYRLNRMLFRFPKPYVAFTHAVTMGGGVGVSAPAPFRIVSEKTLWAMPETGIGLFPDVGGTYYLPRCPGEIGAYLALLGARLKADDLLYAGLSTHYAPTTAIAALLTALETEPPETVFKGVSTSPAAEPPLAAQRTVIDRCFKGDTIEEILSALDSDGGAWAAQTALDMRRKSPLSLRVTLRLARWGRDKSFEDCLRMEHRLARHFTVAADFREGVRAVLIDKDNAPKWSPPNLADVTPAMVDALFQLLPGEPELSFEN